MKNLDLTDIETCIPDTGAANVARVDRLYIASELNSKQSTQWLKEKGVELFIDLKAPGETDYDDKALFSEGAYKNLVFPGIDKVDQDYLNAVNNVLEKVSGNVCVYCKSGNRVVSWLALHLVCVEGHSKKRAAQVAQSFPFFRSAEELKKRLSL